MTRNPNTPILDLTYFGQYVPSVGFKISIDGFHNSPESKHPLVTLTSLSPPGTFYHSPDDVPPAVVLNLTYNWDSPLSSPAYNEGYFKYRDVPSSPTTFLVIDVRKAVLDSKVESIQLLPFGWVILPLFTANQYVRSGHYQLPLLKGPVSPALLSSLHSAGEHDDLWTLFLSSAK